MRSFYFAVELRRARFDIAMPNALVFDMPVEQSLYYSWSKEFLEAGKNKSDKPRSVKKTESGEKLETHLLQLRYVVKIPITRLRRYLCSVVLVQAIRNMSIQI